MITYHSALDILRQEASKVRLAPETIDLSAIHGRICADDVVSPISIPPFDNSAMDGFAVRIADFKEGSAKLQVRARMIAGDAIGTIEVSSGTCCEIMTGAAVPKGADSIVPVELTSRLGELISFGANPQKNEFIRHAGSDFMRGTPVIAQGTLLGTRHILPLAALGIGKVNVYSKPRVAFIPTGSEVVDDLDQALGDGQIYNSSHPYAQNFLTQSGAEFLPQSTIADDTQAFKTAVGRLMGENISLIISSGAVSAGSHDFIRSSLEEMGATIVFHKVAIRPGKPVLFALLPSGTLYLGLPGNPVSTAAGLRFFVHPLLAAMMKLEPEKPSFARVRTRLVQKPPLRLFLKAKIGVSLEGITEVDFLDGQESYKTSPFLAMNGWAVVPEDWTTVNENDIVEIFPLERLF